jgi:hypothetical protein
MDKANDRSVQDANAVRDHVRNMLIKLAALQKEKRAERQTSKGLTPELLKINGEEKIS